MKLIKIALQEIKAECFFLFAIPCNLCCGEKKLYSNLKLFGYSLKSRSIRLNVYDNNSRTIR